MQRLDAIGSWLILGPILPVSLGITGWWSTLLLGWTESVIATAAVGGFLAGGILDLLLRRRISAALMNLGPTALLGVALWYSVMIYGFFMGLPVFNAGVGIVGGLIVGRRAALRGHDAGRVRREARAWALISTSFLLCFCLASAFLALNEATLDEELQHMLGLPFVPTRGMIIALVFGGGAGLLAFQYLGAWLSVILASRFQGTAKPAHRAAGSG